MLRVLSDLCAFTEADGGCCAEAAQGVADASSKSRTTRALGFRKENEKFRVSMSEHGGFILPEAALPERINLLRCARGRITLPRGFSARGEML